VGHEDFSRLMINLEDGTPADARDGVRRGADASFGKPQDDFSSLLRTLPRSRVIRVCEPLIPLAFCWLCFDKPRHHDVLPHVPRGSSTCRRSRRRRATC
jgi:hypothetical protein